ncbi:MAG: signal peptidase I [Acidimicrobiia bacterium]|nr:signal peptidase I [Acidimicrobiia bacterium]
MERAPFDLADLSASHEAMSDARVEAGQRAEMERAKRSFWRELPILMVAALLIAMLIKTFLFQAFFIPSGSMQETLDINDRVLVSKQAFRISDIERYDVIVFDAPNGGDGRDENLLQAFGRNVAESLGLSTPRTEFIKRVIALPGDTVEIQDNRVLVNGELLPEPYLRPGFDMRDREQITVPDGHVWVMGDNRNISDDSRNFGPIEIDSIVGRAVVIVWPPSRWGGL